MRLGISVVVCTYNGAALIPETIRHIAQQQVWPGIKWEVLVVDNASTDDTAQIAAAEWMKYRNPAEFTILYQPKQGLSYARELALAESKYEYVLFCDDDNWLNPDYVSEAYHLMQQHPSIGVLGGYGELKFMPDTPLWAIGHGSFANGPQAKESGKVKHNIVYGAGFVLRKTAFENISKAGFKPMLTDRSGKSLSAGGDWELCFAIALAGYDIWYEERLRFTHFIPKERISWNYCVRFFKEGAQSFEVLMPYRIRVNMGCKDIMTFNLKFIRVFLSHTKKLFPLLIKRIRAPHKSDEAKLAELRLIAIQAQILSFRKYPTMRKNFLKILEIDKQQLSTSSKTGKESVCKELV